MTRYAVIEQSTDSHSRRTKVTFTTSIKKAVGMTKGSGYLTYGEENAKHINNYHHTFIRVYELPEGWRKPTVSKLAEEAYERSRGSYYTTALDVLADKITDVAYEVE